jgi:hypothetical protein
MKTSRRSLAVIVASLLLSSLVAPVLTAYSELCRSAFRLMSIRIPMDADRCSELMPIEKGAWSES